VSAQLWCVSVKVHYYTSVSMSVCVFSVGCVYGSLSLSSLPSSCLHTHSFSRIKKQCLRFSNTLSHLNVLFRLRNVLREIH